MLQVGETVRCVHELICTPTLPDASTQRHHSARHLQLPFLSRFPPFDLDKFHSLSFLFERTSGKSIFPLLSSKEIKFLSVRSLPQVVCVDVYLWGEVGVFIFHIEVVLSLCVSPSVQGSHRISRRLSLRSQWFPVGKPLIGFGASRTRVGANQRPGPRRSRTTF